MIVIWKVKEIETNCHFQCVILVFVIRLNSLTSFHSSKADSELAQKAAINCSQISGLVAGVLSKDLQLVISRPWIHNSRKGKNLDLWHLDHCSHTGTDCGEFDIIYSKQTASFLQGLHCRNPQENRCAVDVEQYILSLGLQEDKLQIWPDLDGENC